MSLGKAIETPQAYDPLVVAVEQVWDAGIVVVCSAGNYGRSGHFTITSPGNSRKVITVGSLTDSGTGGDTSDDYVSTYSSQGPTAYDLILKPDLIAPGNRFVAPIATGSKLLEDLADREVPCGFSTCYGKYLELSGTSMAAAVVSGAVALMLDQEPGLNPGSVKARLMRSARKFPGDATATGAGVLDIQAALEDSGWVDQALSPRMARSEVGEVILVEDTALLWGDVA
ncbi:MAG: S8 family serine peptidase [Acidobacteria bacterium]|nr:S8 family serine peptidase [Acidobacteriota bacterium]